MKRLFMILFVAGVPILAGCASDRIVGPAQQANAVLAKLRNDLSQYQSQYVLVDTAFQTNLSNINAAKDFATADTRILADDLTLISTVKPLDLFTALQTQGKNYTAAALAQPSAGTVGPPPQLPLTKIDGVIKELGQIGTARTFTDEVKFLVTFAQGTNTDLVNIQNSAKKTPQASTTPQTK